MHEVPQGGHIMRTAPARVFLQLLQRFRQQGRDRLACRTRERDQRTFLLGVSHLLHMTFLTGLCG